MFCYNFRLGNNNTDTDIETNIGALEAKASRGGAKHSLLFSSLKPDPKPKFKPKSDSKMSKFWHFTKFTNRCENPLKLNNSTYLYAENTFKLILRTFKC